MNKKKVEYPVERNMYINHLDPSLQKNKNFFNKI